MKLIYLFIISSLFLISLASATIKYEYQFDENNGTTLYEARGRVNGTIYGSPQWVNGLNGSALNFTNNSYQKVVLNSSFSLPTGQKSVSAWVYPRNNNANFESIVSLGTSAACQQFAIVWRNQQFGIQGNTGACDMTSVAGTSTLNTWHHVVAVQQNTTLRMIYVDGINLANLSSASFNFVIGSENQTLGNNGLNSAPFSGIIDKVQMFDHALSAAEVNLLYNGQQLSGTFNFGICNASLTERVLNITFRNETTGLERINATLDATFYYNNGTAVVTYTYTNSTANKEYGFCGSSNYYELGIYGNGSLTYSNNEAQQRTYSWSVFNFTTVTTNLSLFLLPSSQGVDITFQVTSPSQTVISGAIVNTSRSGFGLIEQKITDSTGGATFFMNPLFTYQVCAVATGYEQYCFSVAPTSSQYTIQLGTNQSIFPVSYLRGIDLNIKPYNSSLFVNNSYNFSLTINSGYYVLTNYGFRLINSSGAVLNTSNGTTAGGSSINAYLNTTNNRIIIMNYYWIINGTEKNYTREWVVLSNDGQQYSIYNFANQINTYTNSQTDTDGLFGFSTNGSYNFSMLIFTFLFIMLGTGIVTYRYGINNPGVIMSILFCFVYLFDIMLGWIPNVGTAIPHLPTVIIALITAILIIREELI